MNDDGRAIRGIDYAARPTALAKAYLVISPQIGVVAAVFDKARAEKLAEDYAGVVCELPVLADHRR